MLAPFASSDFTVLVLSLMGLAWLISLLPSCSDPKCAEAHTAHTVTSRAEQIEQIHKTWHGTDRPDPLCALCAARKRDGP